MSTQSSNISDEVNTNLHQLGVDSAALDSFRDVSLDDVAYIMAQYPFLQIINSEFDVSLSHPCTIKPSRSGWDIQDHGNAISSSPGRLLFGGTRLKNTDDDDDDGGGGAGLFLPHCGTLIKQGFDTTFDMMQSAIQNKWAGIRIVDGHPIMQRNLWIHCTNQRVPLEGFNPDETDYDVLLRLQRTPDEVEQIRINLRAS